MLYQQATLAEENAVRNGEGGVFMKCPDVCAVSRSNPTNYLSTSFEAKVCAMLLAAQTFNARGDMPKNTVFLTFCMSLLQSLQSSKRGQLPSKVTEELGTLSLRAELTLQGIPFHCGIAENEAAD